MQLIRATVSESNEKYGGDSSELQCECSDFFKLEQNLLEPAVAAKLYLNYTVAIRNMKYSKRNIYSALSDSGTSKP